MLLFGTRPMKGILSQSGFRDAIKMLSREMSVVSLPPEILNLFNHE